MQRISPPEYFGGYPIQHTLLEGTDYMPLLIFGGICIVAITAIAIVCSRK